MQYKNVSIRIYCAIENSLIMTTKLHNLEPVNATTEYYEFADCQNVIFLITYTAGFTMRETKYMKPNVAVFISNVDTSYEPLLHLIPCVPLSHPWRQFPFT